jgi:signal transduction histidine kinase
MLEASAAKRLEHAERQILRNARRNIGRLRALIDDLLALNQVEAGAMQLDREPLDLRAVVADVIAETHALFREKEQRLEFHVPEPLPIEGDARRQNLGRKRL